MFFPPPPFLKIAGKWSENAFFQWEKVVMPRGYIQKIPPISPPLPIGKKNTGCDFIDQPTRKKIAKWIARKIISVKTSS